ncbi:prepro-urotensin II-beta-like isoform X1 [Cyclopterus lumpus]|uniref:Uncharacterized protein n=1 Tax=Cyclopterus lumpus TaxID=8103 RepID=A0A8C2ZNX0_CYCLU|nr:prepro-urotensin II-beta-like isoform X1 [Cyclopterus lumpus]
MKFNHLLSWAFLLVASGPLLAHPITESAEMPYPGPVSVEDGGVGALDDLSEQTFPSRDGAGLRYSTLISGEYNKDETLCYKFELIHTSIPFFFGWIQSSTTGEPGSWRCQNRPASQGDEKRGPIGETKSPKSFQPCVGHPETVQEESGEF